MPCLNGVETDGDEHEVAEFVGVGEEREDTVTILEVLGFSCGSEMCDGVEAVRLQVLACPKSPHSGLTTASSHVCFPPRQLFRTARKQGGEEERTEVGRSW